jgi:fumarate reductase flavoprotein subunit
VSPYPAQPLVQPPFYAIPLCAGITYTMGGILIDGQARVLHEDGGAIAGLYAAGATTGGLEGGPLAGYVGGLLKAGVMGMRAAQCIAGSRQTDKSTDCQVLA